MKMADAEPLSGPPEAIYADVSMIDAVSKQLGDKVSKEQITSVLTALDTLQTGDPIGVVRMDKVTGRLAHRVEINGVPQWRVTGVDGERYNDLQPTLSWEPIFWPESKA